MKPAQFIEEIYEIAWGDNAINREFSFEEVIERVRLFSDLAHLQETNKTLTELKEKCLVILKKQATTEGLYAHNIVEEIAIKDSDILEISKRHKWLRDAYGPDVETNCDYVDPLDSEHLGPIDEMRSRLEAYLADYIERKMKC